MKGIFITFEGGEGAGKSTQAKLLADRIRERGRTPVLTHEPIGEIRALLVEGDPGRWSVEAETLLNYAQRDAHLRTLIRPALARGEVVVCDRFMDSTRAYQGHAGGCDLGFIDELERRIVGDTRPDLTIVFDLDPSVGLARAKTRGGADRYERKGLDFHATLREAFRAIAHTDSLRYRLIDAAETVESIADTIWRLVEPRVA
jgi:dTMP kinase